MARRLIALLVAALVLIEGAGVARALAGASEGIECCCGRHDVRRVCKCKACPVSQRRAQAATTRLDQTRDCDGHEDLGVLSVVALPLAAPPSLLALAPVALVSAQPPALVGRLVEAGRPPP